MTFGIFTGHNCTAYVIFPVISL